MESRLVAFVACLAIACTSNVDPTALRGHADLVFLSGAVYTVDPRHPWAEAVAIRGGRILERRKTLPARRDGACWRVESWWVRG